MDFENENSQYYEGLSKAEYDKHLELAKHYDTQADLEKENKALRNQVAELEEAKTHLLAICDVRRERETMLRDALKSSYNAASRYPFSEQNADGCFNCASVISSCEEALQSTQAEADTYIDQLKAEAAKIERERILEELDVFLHFVGDDPEQRIAKIRLEDLKKAIQQPLASESTKGEGV